MKRHSRWLRVDAGAEIVTGRPYRVEYAGEYAEEDIATKVLEVPRSSKGTWFVDGDWKPPLVLPTEPTWGIAVRRDKNGETFAIGDEWYESDESFTSGLCNWSADCIVAFIPLTDEQVARIEAAR